MRQNVFRILRSIWLATALCWVVFCLYRRQISPIVQFDWMVATGVAALVGIAVQIRTFWKDGWHPFFQQVRNFCIHFTCCFAFAAGTYVFGEITNAALYTTSVVLACVAGVFIASSFVLALLAIGRVS